MKHQLNNELDSYLELMCVFFLLLLIRLRILFEHHWHLTMYFVAWELEDLTKLEQYWD